MRLDIKKILKDPKARRRLFAETIQAMASHEGRDVSMEYCYEIYDSSMADWKGTWLQPKV